MKQLSVNNSKRWTALGLVTLVALAIVFRRRRAAAAATASEVVETEDNDV